MTISLQFIVLPLLTCMLLLLLTSYFGIHVLKREIIFIDIALAQIAALGGAAAIFLDHRLGTHDIMIGQMNLTDILAYSFSLFFSLGSAIIFAFLKNPKINIPIEAFIGIAYASATTAAVIILDKGAGGDVHLHDMLAGALLWTTWPQFVRLTVILLGVGIFHAAYRKRFILLSESYNQESPVISHQRWWDFLFYFSFSLVVIEAVRIAGVLTVFAFLILPASISALFSGLWFQRVLIGLLSGILAAAAGLYLSLRMDLTASPLIILLLAFILLAGLIAKEIIVRKYPVK
jgi:zinc/manganese transport system permease protein